MYKKTLEEQLEKALEQINDLKRVNNEVEEELEKYRNKEREEMMTLKKDHHRSEQEIKRLLEIIRWFMNPETAKSPFLLDKSQIHEKDYRRNWDMNL